MIAFKGPIEECVIHARDNPKVLQSLRIQNTTEHAFLLKLLKEDPSLVLLLHSSQYSDEVYLAMIEYDLELFTRIPKTRRTEAMKRKALSIDPGSIYLLSNDEISYDVIKYLYIHAPYILEEAPKFMQKFIKPHMKQIKKAKVFSVYNED